MKTDRRALLARARRARTARRRVSRRELTVGDLMFDPRSLTARFCGQELTLPPKCIRLLETLMSQPDRVFSRKELETAVWGEEQETSDTLRSHMHALRRALSAAADYDPIETVHGFGYRLSSTAER